MIDLSTLIAGPFFTSFFETIGEKIASSGIKLVQGKANKILDSFGNSKIANLYLERTVYKIFVFRTITKGDRDVYLDEIYHPLKLRKMNHKSKGTNRILIIGDNSKLDSSECNVIVGLAGQGKTTVMRKLFLEEIVRAERLPFFINLRQCDFTENGCAEILLEHLNTNGIECKILAVINLLKTKKVIFYWDGFDEISASQRNNALDVIMSVHDMYGCSSIVTTRPDTEITRQPRTQRYDVEFLDDEDVSSMVVKIIDNQDVSDSILAVLKEKEFLEQTIKTPILVDVLIVTSSSLCDNPNSIGDYYNQLFPSLIFRHDLNKNYNREKKSSLSNKSLEECFGFFSFFSLMESNSDFSLNSMLAYFKRSGEAKKITDPAEQFCSDIVEGTNLIVRDGYDNYVYIHRSVQEYFCAKCISQFNLNQKSIFLNKYGYLEQKKKNIDMLAMLSHIDSIDFYKLYLIPLLEKMEVIYQNKIIIKSYDDISKAIDRWMVGVDSNYDYGISVISSYEESNEKKYCYLKYFGHALTLKNIDVDPQEHTMYIMNDYEGDIIRFIKGNEGKTFKRDEYKQLGRDLNWLRLADVRHVLENFDELVVTNFYDYYLESARLLQETIDEEYVKKIEGDIIISGMLNEMGY